MKVLVRVDDPDLDILGSLRAWLAAEPAVRGHGALRTTDTRPDPRSGRMGAVEVLALVLGTGLSAGQLLLAIAQWRATRPRPPAVVISIAEPDGTSVRIESDDPQALAAAARALEGTPEAG